MRAVVQRVSRASVRVGDRLTGEIGAGLLVFAGVGIDDEPADADWLGGKVCALRIFRDDAGLMNRSVVEAGGAVLLVSQFTLHGDARKGRRPSFVRAAKEPQARSLFERLGEAIAAHGLPLAFGEFGAEMEVALVNAGPVTVLLDSKREF
ncbi:MAG: D-tyrosyl-tRNA(Tyr) deacylase [Candidatus Eremiobacteraeota bacterium]|nr:D-tyrosyl-tRNA(Tyr) deacylase [Candidatus Eremiobacteraeota bacterium]